jgi:hypothetical protein
MHVQELDDPISERHLEVSIRVTFMVYPGDTAFCSAIPMRLDGNGGSEEVNNLVSLTISWAVNLPNLTYLWNRNSSLTSSDPNELFQVRPHSDCPVLDDRRPDFAKFGSANRVGSKISLREPVSSMQSNKLTKI